MTARRAGVTALMFSLAGVTLMLLLASLAARTGPSGIIHGTAVDPSIHLATPTVVQSSEPPDDRVHDDSGLPRRSSHGSAAWIGLLIKLAVGAYLVVLLFRGLRKGLRAWQERSRPEPPPEDVDFDVLDHPELVVEQIRQDADDQLELLRVGSPRNAIVACWDRFEEQAERIDAARLLWETSTEFTLRLLAAVSADPAAVHRLAELYLEARFSVHPIEEPSRQAAIEALEAIHASLGISRGVRR